MGQEVIGPRPGKAGRIHHPVAMSVFMDNEVFEVSVPFLHESPGSIVSPLPSGIAKGYFDDRPERIDGAPL
jgi:hypothetical protein